MCYVWIELNYIKLYKIYVNNIYVKVYWNYIIIYKKYENIQ